MVIAKTGPGARTSLFDHPDNVLGSPDLVHGIAEFGPTLGTVGNPDSDEPAVIGHDRYLIIGPSSQGGQDAQRTILATRTRPAATRWHRSAGMEFRIDQDALAAPISVLLRRLANPHLPPDPRPTLGDGANPFYNPYITVDYLERIPLQASPVATQSMGKLQPFASHPNRIERQTAEQGGGTRHTRPQLPLLFASMLFLVKTPLNDAEMPIPSPRFMCAALPVTVAVPAASIPIKLSVATFPTWMAASLTVTIPVPAEEEDVSARRIVDISALTDPTWPIRDIIVPPRPGPIAVSGVSPPPQIFAQAMK